MRVNNLSTILIVLITILSVKTILIFFNIQQQNLDNSILINSAYAKNEKTEKNLKKEKKNNPITTQKPEENKLDGAVILEPARMQLLKELSKRKEVLDKFESELKLKEDLMKIAVVNLDKKVDHLQQIQASINADLNKYKELEETRIKSLVKIYENMKPKEAAKIFDELDVNTLFNLVVNMKELKAAPIIANMNVNKAKELSIELSKKKTFN